METKTKLIAFIASCLSCWFLYLFGVDLSVSVPLALIVFCFWAADTQVNTKTKVITFIIFCLFCWFVYERDINPAGVFAPLAFVVFCFMCCSIEKHGGKKRFRDIMYRLFARNIKLALKMGVGFILAVLAAMWIFEAAARASTAQPGYVGFKSGRGEGSETTKLANFANIATAPAQFVVDGFLSALGIITLLVCIACQSLWDYICQNPIPFWILGGIIYVVWLVFTTKNIIRDEFRVSDGWRNPPGYMLYGQPNVDGVTYAAVGLWLAILMIGCAFVAMMTGGRR